MNPFVRPARGVQSAQFRGGNHGKDQLGQGDPRWARRRGDHYIFEYVLNGVVLAKDMETAISALGKQMGAGALAMFVVWGFLVGIFALWLYAAIRPRYGAGPKTAICAGAAVWGLGYLLASVTPIALNLFPARIMAIGLAVGLVEVLVGTLAGASLYREQTV